MKIDKNEAPYQTFIDREELEQAGEKITDNSKVLDWFIEMSKYFYIAAIGVDPNKFQEY